MTTVQSKVIAPWSNELFQCQGDPSIGMSYGEGMSWVCVRRAYVSRAGRTMPRETRRTTFSSRLRLGSGWTGSVVVLSCPFKLRDVTHFIASSGQSIQTAKRSMVGGRPRKESAEHQEQLSPRAGNRLQRTAQCSEEKERDEGCKRYAASHRPQHRPTSHPCPNGVRI